jgi:antitoxin (DNA-binding transcriptional repressor) of toxin-antitoxin stability system
MDSVTIIELREFEAHPGDIVRRVRDYREPIDLVENGQIVARLTPPPGPDRQALKTFLDEHDRLAQEIGKYWPAGLSAVDAIAQDREK